MKIKNEKKNVDKTSTSTSFTSTHFTCLE